MTSSFSLKYRTRITTNTSLCVVEYHIYTPRFNNVKYCSQPKYRPSLRYLHIIYIFVIFKALTAQIVNILFINWWKSFFLSFCTKASCLQVLHFSKHPAEHLRHSNVLVWDESNLFILRMNHSNHLIRFIIKLAHHFVMVSRFLMVSCFGYLCKRNYEF